MVGFERKKGCLGSLFLIQQGPKNGKRETCIRLDARFPGANACEIPAQPGRA
ncbi:hypothetical protein HMPREF3213_02585 [Heyndrickxia coagulans]|uniref:Uncharacterized protein n=1 Tax=Heyndrickxia coagulans TaxID=1398 RepID=A0A133KIS4_HEYCO|nr:hypothetical protein HMPREF3213_02585 [Heyndrickxia coagulans]